MREERSPRESDAPSRAATPTKVVDGLARRETKKAFVAWKGFPIENPGFFFAIVTKYSPFPEECATAPAEHSLSRMMREMSHEAVHARYIDTELRIRFTRERDYSKGSRGSSRSNTESSNTCNDGSSSSSSDTTNSSVDSKGDSNSSISTDGNGNSRHRSSSTSSRYSNTTRISDGTHGISNAMNSSRSESTPTSTNNSSGDNSRSNGSCSSFATNRSSRRSTCSGVSGSIDSSNMSTGARDSTHESSISFSTRSRYSSGTDDSKSNGINSCSSRCISSTGHYCSSSDTNPTNRNGCTDIRSTGTHGSSNRSTSGTISIVGSWNSDYSPQNCSYSRSYHKMADGVVNSVTSSCPAESLDGEKRNKVIISNTSSRTRHKYSKISKSSSETSRGSDSINEKQTRCFKTNNIWDTTVNTTTTNTST
ncbi:uncharacterized protein DDB_G0271670-like [Ochotona princeps]|uniref:uncharacterized protein DDB_G0271670-like n=1 Tax=Ochotona princeps TaxID=9978 RepID=UPI00271505C0|nr:uncharacterized protein DDB_G0271670-like [Ochotona princeps]